jgi:hypothetical protein
MVACIVFGARRVSAAIIPARIPLTITARHGVGLVQSVPSTMRTPVLCLSLLLIVVPSVTGAQRALQTGDRVRVVAPPTTDKSTTAVITSVSADALTLGFKKQRSRLVIPWTGITRLEVSEPRTRRQGVLHAAKWGLAIGTVLGVISLTTPMPEGEDFSESMLALEAVADGVLIGAFVGAIRPGRHWRRLNVAETRDATRLAVATPVAAAPAPAPPTISRQAGTTPAFEYTVGFSAPVSRHAQFPGAAMALAINAGWTQTLGASLVGEMHAAIFRAALMGGARVYARSAPLYSGRRVTTFFGQVLAGKLRPEVSGVVRSNGGFAVQPGAGIDYGSGFFSGRLEVDYTIVPDGYVDDDRVVGRHVEELTGWRVVVGTTLRTRGW